MLASSACARSPRSMRCSRRLRIVGRDAEVGLPQVLDVDRFADQFAQRTGDGLAHAPALDQRDQRQPVEVAGRVRAECLARHVDRALHRLVGGHQCGHHRADARAADAVDLDALLLQGAPDAEMREAARTAAGEHESDRVAAQQARQARHVAVEPAAQVNVAGDRPPREPVARAARQPRIGRMQQHEDLGGLDARAGGPGGRPARPHGRRRAAWHRRAAASRRCGARSGASTHPGAESASSSTKSFVASMASSAVGDRLVARGHRRPRSPPPLPIARSIAHASMTLTRPNRCSCGPSSRARSLADTPSDTGSTPIVTGAGSGRRWFCVCSRWMIWRVSVCDDLRAQREQAVEARLVELHEDGVAHRDHRRRARLAGEQAHLADHLAASDLAHHPLARRFRRARRRAAGRSASGSRNRPPGPAPSARRRPRVPPTAGAGAGTPSRSPRHRPAAAPVVRRAALRGGVRRSSSCVRVEREGRHRSDPGDVSARPSTPATRRTAHGRARRAAG